MIITTTNKQTKTVLRLIFRYNPLVDPSISSEFSTAAFRFGHAQIHPIQYRLDKNYEEIPQVTIAGFCRVISTAAVMMIIELNEPDVYCPCFSQDCHCHDHYDNKLFDSEAVAKKIEEAS